MRPMKRILYVEDNEINALVVEFMLKKHYDVLLAPTPQCAISILEEGGIDLILMDMNLGDPHYDGLGLAQYIWEQDLSGTAPIIGVSANYYPDFVEEVLAKGFADFLGKPVAMSDLLASIRNALRGGLDRKVA